MQFVCMLWRGRGFWKDVAGYDDRDVRYLAASLQRFGHELTCIHDGAFNLYDIPVKQIVKPELFRMSDYLPKLWLWSDELHKQFSQAFAYIDLDCLVLGDPALAFHPERPLQFWDYARAEPYNTSLVHITPGHGLQIWEHRDQIGEAKGAWPYWTGDQSFVGWILGPHHATFGREQGIRNYGRWCEAREPDDVRAIFFCGPRSPRTQAEVTPWVARHLNLMVSETSAP